LEAKLQETNTFREEVAIAEKFLLARLKNCYKHTEFSRIDFCLSEIGRTKGLASTKKLSGFTPGEYFECCEPYSDYFD
jgi:hypothetical protein